MTEFLPRTRRAYDNQAFPSNITSGATVTEIVAQATAPAVGVLVANEVAILGWCSQECCLQVWSESGVSIDCRVFGLVPRADGKLNVRALLQFRATMHNQGGTLLGADTLFPALTHAINLNNVNAKVLDGSATYKMPGSILFDGLGMLIGVGLNRVSGTPKANVFASLT